MKITRLSRLGHEGSDIVAERIATCPRNHFDSSLYIITYVCYNLATNIAVSFVLAVIGDFISFILIILFNSNLRRSTVLTRK